MNRKTAPPIKDAVDFELHLKPYEYFALDNGVPVYSVDAGTQEVMQVELVFYAGNWFEQQKTVATATNFLLKNGTGKRTAFQLNDDFEYYGAFCQRASYNETAVLSLSTLSKHLGRLLPVVEDMITDSIFPEEELAVYKQNTRQRLSVNLQKCDFVASRLIDSFIYGEAHPYGSFSKAADIDALTREQVVSHFNQYYLNGRFMIFVSGKIPPGTDQLLNAHFGQQSIQAPAFNAAPVSVMSSGEKKYRVLNDPNGVQGAIKIARPFPSMHHPDFMKAKVLNTLFGGFFGSRLMGNIREEKGYTYGIHSYIQNHMKQSAWLISTEAGRDVCEATITEVYKEMQLLREEPVGAEELSLVRNYLIGTLLGDLDGPFHIMSKWKNIIMNELGADYFYDSIKTIKNISAEELMELAKKYLLPEEFYELVVT